MKTVIRAGFLLLMALAVQERVIWYRLGHSGAAPLITLTRKITLLGLETPGPDENGLIQTSAPGCRFPFPIGMFALDGGEDTRISGLLPLGSTPIYIYLGNVRATRAQLHPIAAWLTASLAAMIGARATQPPTKFVLSALPGECPALAKLDWASLSQ